MKTKTPFPIASSNIKYLGITVLKQLKALYNRNFKTLKKEIEKDIRK